MNNSQTKLALSALFYMVVASAAYTAATAFGQTHGKALLIAGAVEVVALIALAIVGKPVSADVSAPTGLAALTGMLVAGAVAASCPCLGIVALLPAVLSVYLAGEFCYMGSLVYLTILIEAVGLGAAFSLAQTELGVATIVISIATLLIAAIAINGYLKSSKKS